MFEYKTAKYTKEDVCLVIKVSQSVNKLSQSLRTETIVLLVILGTFILRHDYSKLACYKIKMSVCLPSEGHDTVLY